MKLFYDTWDAFWDRFLNFFGIVFPHFLGHIFNSLWDNGAFLRRCGTSKGIYSFIIFSGKVISKFVSYSSLTCMTSFSRMYCVACSGRDSRNRLSREWKIPDACKLPDRSLPPPNPHPNPKDPMPSVDRHIQPQDATSPAANIYHLPSCSKPAVSFAIFWFHPRPFQ